MMAAASRSGGRDDGDASPQADVADDGELIMQGMLMKQGHVVRSWRLRRFVLTTTALTYFDETRQRQRGRVAISDVVDVDLDVDNPLLFTITLEGGKVYRMTAASSTARQQWVDAVASARFQQPLRTRLLRLVDTIARLRDLDDGMVKQLRDKVVETLEPAALKKIADTLNEAARRAQEGSTIAPEFNDMLQTLMEASTEVQLIDALGGLQRIVGSASMPPRLAQQIRVLCSAHEQADDGRWTPQVAHARKCLLDAIDERDPSQAEAARAKATKAPVDGDEVAAPAERAAGGGGGLPAGGAATGTIAEVNLSTRNLLAGQPGDPMLQRAPSIAEEEDEDEAAEDEAAEDEAAEDEAAEAKPGASKPGAAPLGSEAFILQRCDTRQFQDVYDLGSDLGTGAYSVVRRATERATGQVVAAKLVRKDPVRGDATVMRSFCREVEIGLSLRHPHIVRLFAVFNLPNHWVLITELMTGGELFDRIVDRQQYSERQARDAVKSLCEAIAYLHSQGIAHRDLKPENILLASTDADAPLKLADLGFASRLPDNARVRALAPVTDRSGRTAGRIGLRTPCGTPSYVAPEVLQRQPYGLRVDVWSLGVIAFILLCGYTPFQDSTQQGLFRRIKRGAFRFDPAYWREVSEPAKDLIRKMLTVNPATRLTAEEVLQHPWITGTVGSAELGHALRQLEGFNSERRTTLYEGLLSKQARGVFGSWQERLFKLHGDRLVYHVPATGVKKGEVLIQSITALEPLDRPGSFVLQCGRRRLVLQATDDEARAEWLRAINAQLERRRLMAGAEAAMRDDRVEVAISLIRDARQIERYLAAGGGGDGNDNNGGGEQEQLPAAAAGGGGSGGMLTAAGAALTEADLDAEWEVVTAPSAAETMAMEEEVESAARPAPAATMSSDV